MRLRLPPIEIVHNQVDQERIDDKQTIPPQRVHAKHVQRGGNRNGFHERAELHDLRPDNIELHLRIQQSAPGQGLVPCKPVGNQLERRHAPANNTFLIEEVVLPDPAGWLPLFLCFGSQPPRRRPLSTAHRFRLVRVFFPS